ncbi:MAG TPA: hypothetical protein GXX17_05325 [Clostridiales bacterium]|nr:hypothetical protein [Clostridiales bacterium]
MILYTVVPYENIFPFKPDKKIQYLQVEHGFVEVSKGEEGTTVKRLFSTLPSDYLNPKYTPGSVFKGY